MRGTFTASATGCEVDYRIEFMPMLLWAIVLSYAVGIPVVLTVVGSGYVPVSALAWLIVITAIGLPLNFWLSERQAARLKEYVDSVLDLRPIGT
jgi:hypothetical protein